MQLLQLSRLPALWSAHGKSNLQPAGSFEALHVWGPYEGLNRRNLKQTKALLKLVRGSPAEEMDPLQRLGRACTRAEQAVLPSGADFYVSC